MIPTKQQMMEMCENYDDEKDIKNTNEDDIIELLFETMRFRIFITKFLQESVLYKFSDIKFSRIMRICNKINKNFCWKNQNKRVELVTKLIELLQNLGYGGICFYKKEHILPYTIRIQYYAKNQFTNLYF
jgi:hypothetical protein